MLNKVELVIPTHWSKKGFRNGSWGPPGDGWIRKTVNSLYKRCPDARKVTTTVSQNVHSEHGDEYSEVLRRFCDEFGFTLRLDLSDGFRGMRLGMCEWVRLPYLFLVEHDWEWKQDIDLVSIIQTFEEHDHVNYVRFNKRANIVKQVLTATRRVGGDLYLMRDDRLDIPLLHTPQYSNTPHIERMTKYREWCKDVEANPVHAGRNGGAAGFEHPLQELSLNDLEMLGIEKRNEMWGTYIYGNVGDPQVVEHFGI